MDAAIIGKINEDELAIETLVMTIRENLMEYFKGTCVKRIVNSPSLTMVDLARYANTRYSYQRQRLEQEQPLMLLFDKTPLITVRKAPSRVTFHTGVLLRSPQLQKVYKQLNLFMDKYLQGVEKEDNHANVTFQ